MARILAPFLLAVMVNATAASADLVSLHGSTTIINAIVAPKGAQIERLSGQQLDVVGNGSQRGLADLAAGRAQIAMISTPLETELVKMPQNDRSTINAGRLENHPIGELVAAFVVHPSNPVTSLNDAQLTDLLSGKFNNWKQLGGNDQPIIIVAAQPGDGVRSNVETHFLKTGSLPSDTRAMINITQVPKVVSQLPGAIGIIARTSLDDSVVALHGISTVSLPLSLVTMDDAAPAVRQVVEAIEKIGASP